MVLWHSSSGSPPDESAVCFLYFFWFCCFCCFWASTFFRSSSNLVCTSSNLVCTSSTFFFRSSWPVSTFFFRSSTFFCKSSRPASIFFFTSCLACCALDSTLFFASCLVWSETSPHPVTDPTSTSTASTPSNTRTFLLFSFNKHHMRVATLPRPLFITSPSVVRSMTVCLRPPAHIP